MPRPRKHVLSYRFHKQSGQAIVTISVNGTRRDVLLGKHGTPESKAEYRRILAELQSSPSSTVLAAGTRPTDATVGDLIVAFMEWAATHYRNQAGEPTSEISELKWSLRPLRDLYAHSLAREFGPRALAAVRQHMIGLGWCRTLINRRLDRVKRVFRWATSEELVPVTVYTALRTLAGLRRGRSEARESEPVKPVDPAHVAATLPHLTRHLRAMVELQMLSGCRPGEVRKLTLAEVDRSGELWVYRPSQHKTAHRDRARGIYFGPKARAVLVTFLVGDKPPPVGWEGVNLVEDRTGRLAMANAFQEAGRERDVVLLRDLERVVVLVGGCVVDPAAPVFSPMEARAERFHALRAKRKRKVQPSQVNRKKKNPMRQPRNQYGSESYAATVANAAKRAGVPAWHPNQLRHLHATMVRQKFGLEAAGATLGHARMSATQVYAERDTSLAAKVASEVG